MMTIKHNQLIIIVDMPTKKSIKFLNITNLAGNVILERSKDLLMDRTGMAKEPILEGGNLRR